MATKACQDYDRAKYSYLSDEFAVAYLFLSATVEVMANQALPGKYVSAIHFMSYDG